MKTGFIKSAAQPDQFPPPYPSEFMVVGRSNCGKSSLLNSLLNQKDLVRTSRTPGRTQLANFFFWGKDIIVVDLPGYGFSKTGDETRKNWQELVEACVERKSIAVAMFLMDIRRDVEEEDADLLEYLGENKQTIIVLTKVDKLNSKERQQRTRYFKDALQTDDFYVVSTQNGEGVPQLRRDLLQSSST